MKKCVATGRITCTANNSAQLRIHLVVTSHSFCYDTVAWAKRFALESIAQTENQGKANYR